MARDLSSESEFGLPLGLAEEDARKAGALGAGAGTGVMYSVGQELREIYATDPSKTGEDLSSVVLERPKNV